MTKVELLTAAARDLHVLGSGQSLSASVQARLNEKYLAIHAMLAKVPGEIPWAADESIPVRFEIPVIQMVQAYSTDVFGISGERKALLLVRGLLYQPQMGLAERTYRRILAEPYVSTPLQQQYY